MCCSLRCFFTFCVSLCSMIVNFSSFAQETDRSSVFNYKIDDTDYLCSPPDILGKFISQCKLRSDTLNQCKNLLEGSTELLSEKDKLINTYTLIISTQEAQVMQLQRELADCKSVEPAGWGTITLFTVGGIAVGAGIIALIFTFK